MLNWYCSTVRRAADAVNDDMWDIANIALSLSAQPYFILTALYSIDANFQVRAGSALTENQQMNSPDVTIILYDEAHMIYG